MKPKKRALARTIAERLARRYPSPMTELSWNTPWELLVATILSAQCTDARVNMVTPHLFAKWQDVETIASAELSDIETIIHSTGFYRNKAKHIREAACIVRDQFAGQVPRSMSSLLTLPGVARKTANVVLSNAFGIHEGIAVDTHVKRISFRLGLTESTDPARIEQDLMPLFPQEKWGDINHFLVLFGRQVCTARKPACTVCELSDICPKSGIPST